MGLDDAAFERALDGQWRPRRRTAPEFWWHHAYTALQQPVVGVCWYEARAYCQWLTAQEGRVVRMPTEAEWEAAARGREGRAFPWGAAFDRLKANTGETRVGRTTPVGVFPTGDTPEGVSDMAGNVLEWTSSLWGEWRDADTPAAFAYPYVADDGREEPEAPVTVARVARGGSWAYGHTASLAAGRHCNPPAFPDLIYGLRLVVPASR